MYVQLEAKKDMIIEFDKSGKGVDEMPEELKPIKELFYMYKGEQWHFELKDMGRR